MSYVYLTLDVESPKLEIFYPRYTTNQLVNIITIESDENLSDYQEIYTFDKNGEKTFYTFKKVSEKVLVGEVKFSDAPIGIINLYARLKDEVHNLSDVVVATIEVKTSLKTVFAKTRDFQSLLTRTKSYSNTVKAKSVSNKVVTNDYGTEERYE